MAGNGANFETYDEIFVLPWHKLHVALYWSRERQKASHCISAFCCQDVWKLHFLGILFQIMRFSRSLVEWYNLYNTMRMKTIRSMKCVKLDAFTLAAFTRHSQETFMDVYGYWMGDWGEFWLLDQVLGSIHVGDWDNQNSGWKHNTLYMVCRVSFSFISLENVFGASSVLLQSVDENRTDQAA